MKTLKSILLIMKKNNELKSVILSARGYSVILKGYGDYLNGIRTRTAALDFQSLICFKFEPELLTSAAKLSDHEAFSLLSAQWAYYMYFPQPYIWYTVEIYRFTASLVQYRSKIIFVSLSYVFA